MTRYQKSTMVKHYYKGWEIRKMEKGKGRYYLSSNLVTYHLAPQGWPTGPRTLKAAKAYIDSGEATLSLAEWKARTIVQDIQASGMSEDYIKIIQWSALSGKKEAEIALASLGLEAQ